MASGETPNRESVLESITVVFSHSKLKEVVGTDALKSVLSGQYRDLVSSGTLNLQIVWDLLADQPDFQAEDAVAPFSVLKTWETELGLEVKLPKSLVDCSATEIMVQASHCPIPKPVKARALNPDGARTKARETVAQMESTGGGRSVATTSTRKPALEAALGLVAVLGLGYGGYTLYGVMGGAKLKTVASSEIQSSLPIAKAKQLGQELSVVIEDDTWYDLPDKARKAALQLTLEDLQSRDITSLIVQDRSGAVRASAQWVGSPAKVSIRLR